MGATDTFLSKVSGLALIFNSECRVIAGILLQIRGNYTQTIDGRRLHVTFTLRDGGKLIRVISARDMHRKERAHYEQAT
jgi:hypothetical protein